MEGYNIKQSNDIHTVAHTPAPAVDIGWCPSVFPPNCFLQNSYVAKCIACAGAII